MLTIGSLFSGIGGLELGLEWAGLGPVRWQVEIDPFCREVLARHWPEAARHEDVRAVGAAALAPVDLICGGFPCQDVSSAGTRKGLAGSRSGLWSEFARVVSELRPRWVVVENVTSGATRWVNPVVRQLEQFGYACLPIPLSAADVGAPHLRRRIFIVAHADHGPQHAVAEHDEMGGARAATGLVAHPNCDERRVQPWGGSGPHWSGEAISRDDGAPRLAADAHGVVGHEGWREAAHQGQRDASGQGPPRSASGRRPPPDAAGQRLQGPERPATCESLAAGGAWTDDTMPEPAIRRMDDGASAAVVRGRKTARNQEIHALGNGVVPQCAEVVGWVIRELICSARPPVADERRGVV